MMRNANDFSVFSFVCVIARTMFPAKDTKKKCKKNGGTTREHT